MCGAWWAHARRKFFDLARLQKAPIAIEVVKRIDALFAIERGINGLTPQQCLAVLRHERSRPLIVELEAWLREQRREALVQERHRQGGQLQSSAVASAHPLPR
jgi:hypothetical protein